MPAAFSVSSAMLSIYFCSLTLILLFTSLLASVHSSYALAFYVHVWLFTADFFCFCTSVSAASDEFIEGASVYKLLSILTHLSKSMYSHQLLIASVVHLCTEAFHEDDVSFWTLVENALELVVEFFLGVSVTAIGTG